MSSHLPSEFLRRFGRLGEVLAAALSVFSLDVVGVVCGYVYPVATQDAVPIKVVEFEFLGNRERRTFTHTRGLAVAPDGNIWHSNGDCLRVFSPTGSLLFQPSSFISCPSPLGLAIDSSNLVFIADASNKIIVCTLGCQLVRKFGRQGKSFGQFDQPWAVTVDHRGHVAVCDSANYRIQLFHTDGRFIRAFGSMGSGDAQLFTPRGLAISDQGEIIMADANNYRIQVFDMEGRFLRKMGSYGILLSPNDIAVDRQGNIFVTDGNRRSTHVVVFKSDGKLLTSWICEAQCVCINDDGQVFVSGERKVEVYAFFV